MITFNIQAHNSNYYRGHRPFNHSGNCWTDKEKYTLVFTIEQARKIVNAWPGFLKIVIATSSEFMTDADFKRGLFCVKGGR